MKKLILFTLIGLLISTLGVAQNNLTIYNMKPIPQKFYANPAKHSDAKIFVGVPGMSSYYMDFGLTAFKLQDVVNSVSDSTFMLTEFTKNFKKQNFISISNSFDIFSVGFKVKRNYFFINASMINNARASVPGDFFEFLAQGNGGANLNRTFDFGFGLDLMSYGEVGLGYSRELLKDKLTVGGRVHLIKGLGVVTTNKSYFKFTTDQQTFNYLLQSDIEVNSANSFTDYNGFDPFDSTTTATPITTAVGDFFKKGNRGAAIDLGVVFKPFKKFEFSASVVNLGKITWNTNTYNWKSANPGATYTFDGLDIRNALEFKGEDVEDALNALGDTLAKVFDLNENTNEFTTSLFAQVFVGGNFNLTKNHNAGLLLHGSFYQKKLNPAVTLSWNSRLTKVLGISASYSMINKSFVNAGLGLSLNLGKVQTYFVSDNIIGLFAVNNVNTFNMRAGLNVTLGRKKKEG